MSDINKLIESREKDLQEQTQAVQTAENEADASKKCLAKGQWKGKSGLKGYMAGSSEARGCCRKGIDQAKLAVSVRQATPSPRK